jgi:hypothetical protein
LKVWSQCFWVEWVEWAHYGFYGWTIANEALYVIRLQTLNSRAVVDPSENLFFFFVLCAIHFIFSHPNPPSNALLSFSSILFFYLHLITIKLRLYTTCSHRQTSNSFLFCFFVINTGFPFLAFDKSPSSHTHGWNHENQ